MDVAIVGGGIGGLSAAIALRRAGAEVVVLERAPTLEPLGAGISLFPNAIHGLHALGIGDDELARAGTIPEGGGVWHRNGDPIVREDFRELDERYGAPLRVFHRADLHEVLAAHAGEVRLNAQVQAVQQDGDEARVILADGDPVAARLVVGADGIRSAVRAALFGEREPVYSGIVAYRGITHLPDPERVGEFWGDGCVFGCVPLTEDRVYWFATQFEPQDAPPRDLKPLFGDWCAPIPAVLDAAIDVLRHPLLDRDPDGRWVEGRVGLLGDAAHPMLPFVGQGACQAIEDAVALGAVVAERGTTPAALTAYQAARHKRAALVVTRARQMAKITHLRSGWQRAVRNTVARHTPAAARRRQMDQVITG